MKASLKREATRKKMLLAATAEFLEHGVGGVGVDGLAKAADMTSGAFYFHFRNKMDAFVAGFEGGLEDLRSGIDRFQKERGAAWVSAFAFFYLGYKRTCELKDACALPVLSADVERAGVVAREAYERKIESVLQSLEGGLDSTSTGDSREQAIVLISMLAGGAMISRTVVDPKLSKEISASIQKFAKQFPARVGAANRLA